jgi:hypothetical protein
VQYNFMQIGDLATWVGSVATAGALLFTAYTLKRQIDRERANDDYQRRLSARRVNVSLVEKKPRVVVDIKNNGDDDIYTVGVYIQDKVSGSFWAKSKEPQDVIIAKDTARFTLTPEPADTPLPGNFILVAQLTDGNGYKWNRYMRGKIEPVDRYGNPGPWPTDQTSKPFIRLFRARLSERPSG